MVFNGLEASGWRESIPRAPNSQSLLGIEQAAAEAWGHVRPQSKCGQVWRFADCRPRITNAPIVLGETMLLGRVDQHIARWREIGSQTVDFAVKPLAIFELIQIRAPFDKLHPLAWAAPKNHGDGSFAGKNKVETAGRNRCRHG